MKVLSLILPFVGFYPTAAEAVTLYDEGIQNDLSNTASRPTEVGTLVLGNNLVIGSINETGPTHQPDVFEFIVPEGLLLSSVTVDVSSTGQNHFLALFDESVSFFGDGFFLFATLVTGVQGGVNLLELESDGGSFGNDPDVNADGFDAPLPAGNYGLWLQETTVTGPVNYTFTLNTVSVPEPSSLAMLMVGLLSVLPRRRSSFH